MEEGDGLPTQVCLQCVHYISRAFSFKQLCERSDATLRQILGHPVQTFIELKPYNQSSVVVAVECAERPVSVSGEVDTPKNDTPGE